MSNDELARVHAEREQLLAMMREANERLILASLRSEALRERLAAALDASGTGTFRCENRTRDLDADDNMRALFGVRSEARFDRLDDLLARVRADHREELARRWAAAVEAGEDLQAEVQALDGRWLYLRGRTYIGAKDSPAYVLGACVDVTARKRVAEEQAANRAKDEFLAILGHELRNPLSPILAALHLMREKAARGDVDVVRERQVIERQADHLVRLVDDLLDIARISQGKIVLDPRRVDLAEVVSTAVELSSSLVAQRRHRIVEQVRRDALYVDGDPARLAQVVANLLTNAAKYTPPGGRIEIEASQDGAEVVLEVRDDGIGIPTHLLPRIFDLFVQGERAPDRGEGGLGIGLTIVKSLVAMHGGVVSAASDGPGKGSTFRIRIPAAAPAVEAGAVDPVPPTRGIERRVLVVDDNTDVADLVADVLRGQGHTVRVAYDGAAALRLAESFRPETALVDIGLPVMDGYELAANLRARLGEQCPRLIAITGYGQPRDRERATAAGFDQHIVKPVDVARLIALVGE